MTGLMNNKILHIYEKASGAISNEEKTKKMLFGKYRRENSVLVQDPVEILGVKFHHDLLTRLETNWTEIVTSIKTNLNRWKTRHMTILGKTTVINAFVISQLLHVKRILPIPPTKREFLSTSKISMSVSLS